MLLNCKYRIEKVNLHANKKSTVCLTKSILVSVVFLFLEDVTKVHLSVKRSVQFH